MARAATAAATALFVGVSLAAGGQVSPGPAPKAPGDGYIWWEAEAALEHTFPESNAFKAYTPQEKEKLSGGDWLQTDKGANVTARWVVDVPRGGEYGFWTRKFWHHGPFRWRWNDAPWQTCGRDCSLADSVELRKFLCANWVYLGKVSLAAGKNTLSIQALPDATAIAFDCWLLARGPFTPNGPKKPGEKYGRAEEGYFPWEPDPDTFEASAFFDLRALNQKRAGDDGFVKAKGMDFVFERTGQKVKFWAVNADAHYDDQASVDFLARRLAKMGVNMVRVHSAIFDQNAEDPTAINTRYLAQLHYFVAAMAKEGIYTKLSFYFPLWFQVKPSSGLPGYDKIGNKHPFALLFFHPRMQEIYRSWAKALLTTKNPHTGKSLAEDPAVGIVEIVNEDNYFFWTFTPHENIPAECMRPLEKAFGDWLAAKYGSLDRAREAWGPGGAGAKGDDFPAGRVGLYAAGMLTGQDWAVRGRNQARARDQAQFLTENLRRFYADMAQYFRKELGVRCCISATNWTTADNRVLGALDKYTNMACDVLDRHAYFGGKHEGEGSGWSVRVGHVYEDKTGMYGPESLTQELQYLDRPHICSEYSYQMVNRFRAECPWLTATYGSLAGTDGFFFFALGTADWQKENTKWPVYTPVTMGQFPAAALAYRKGYVKEGPVVYHAAVRLADLYGLSGTPVAQPQNLDELRKADVPAGGSRELERPASMDPLAYYVGQVTMEVAEEPRTKSRVTDITGYIDRQKKVVKSATGELAWDWARGVATLSAPCAQGACGFLKAAGELALGDVSVRSGNEYGALLVVSLDGEPIARSKKMLLQVMTEDRNYGWKTTGEGTKTISDLGSPPIVVRDVAGSVSLRRPDASTLKVWALDENGYKRQELPGGASRIELQRDCVYYAIQK